jgi:membrane protease YdiL (CAAX protease family)
METLHPTVASRTIQGIIFALFGVPLLITSFQYFAPDVYSDQFILGRELSIFLVSAMFLFWMVRSEGYPLSSIGLHGRNWGKSLVIALVGLLISFAVGALVILGLNAAGIPFGSGGEAQRFSDVSPWVIFIMVSRAGIVEEIFYRGYLMERLYMLNKNKFVYFLFPLVVFALWHYRQGVGGIIVSFCLGAVLAFLYWKKRDLKANIIAHFLVDFIPNIIVPLFD